MAGHDDHDRSDVGVIIYSGTHEACVILQLALAAEGITVDVDPLLTRYPFDAAAQVLVGREDVERALPIVEAFKRGDAAG
jgi:hypothetical protein